MLVLKIKGHLSIFYLYIIYTIIWTILYLYLCLGQCKCGASASSGTCTSTGSGTSAGSWYAWSSCCTSGSRPSSSSGCCSSGRQPEPISQHFNEQQYTSPGPGSACRTQITGGEDDSTQPRGHYNNGGNGAYDESTFPRSSWRRPSWPSCWTNTAAGPSLRPRGHRLDGSLPGSEHRAHSRLSELTLQTLHTVLEQADLNPVRMASHPTVGLLQSAVLLIDLEGVRIYLKRNTSMVTYYSNPCES